MMEFSWLPGKCLLCDGATRRPMDLCNECESDLPWLTTCCKVCALPLPTEAGSICGPCLTDPPPFLQTSAIFEYVWPIDQMIMRFKNQGNLAMGRVLSELLIRANRLRQYPDTLVPVPLHARKARSRGFNQSMEIASRLSRAWGIPIDKNCRRIRDTQDQKQLTISNRFQNIRGAFTTKALYTGSHVTIIDDVVTTTATIRELSRLLVNSGASTVSIVCLARTRSRH